MKNGSVNQIRYINNIFYKNNAIIIKLLQQYILIIKMNATALNKYVNCNNNTKKFRITTKKVIFRATLYTPKFTLNNTSFFTNFRCSSTDKRRYEKFVNNTSDNNSTKSRLKTETSVQKTKVSSPLKKKSFYETKKINTIYTSSISNNIKKYVHKSVPSGMKQISVNTSHKSVFESKCITLEAVKNKSENKTFTKYTHVKAKTFGNSSPISQPTHHIQKKKNNSINYSKFCKFSENKNNHTFVTKKIVPMNKIDSKQKNNIPKTPIVKQKKKISSISQIAKKIPLVKVDTKKRNSSETDKSKNVTPLRKKDSMDSRSTQKTCVSMSNSISCSSKTMNIFQNHNLLCKTIKKIEPITRGGKNGNLTPKVNQDNYFVVTRDTYTLLGVCDGHGTSGELVSTYVKNTLPEVFASELKEKVNGIYLSSFPNETKIVKKVLENSFISTNSKLLNNTKIDTTFNGTTCVMALCLNYPSTPNKVRKIYVANVGDSRGIIIKSPKDNSSQWKYEALSRDHKPSEPDEKERITRFGGVVKQFQNQEGVASGPMRIYLKKGNLPGLAMSRSFGDQIASSVGLICEPEVQEYIPKEEDKYLILASDGFWEYISSEKCSEIVGDYHEYVNNNCKYNLADILYKEALKMWKENDVNIDDITIIVSSLE